MFLHQKKPLLKQSVSPLYKYWIFISILFIVCICIVSYLYAEKGSDVQVLKTSTGIHKLIGTTKPEISSDHLCLQVDGVSMQGILDSGEYIWAKKIKEAKTEISRGDIIVVNQAGYSNDLIKEVRGIPGDTLSVHDLETEGKSYYSGSTIAGSFFIEINNAPLFLHDGTLLVYQPGKKALFSLYAGKLGDNSYLIFGTQQGGTYDSSRYGPIAGDAIIGKMQEHEKNDDFCKNKKLGLNNT